jgi:hypothetical protein
MLCSISDLLKSPSVSFLPTHWLQKPIWFQISFIFKPKCNFLIKICPPGSNVFLCTILWVACIIQSYFIFNFSSHSIQLWKDRNYVSFARESPKSIPGLEYQSSFHKHLSIIYIKKCMSVNNLQNQGRMWKF